IDLGSTHLAAALRQEQRAIPMTFQGATRLPAQALLRGSELYIGQEAEARAGSGTLVVFQRAAFAVPAQDVAVRHQWRSGDAAALVLQALRERSSRELGATVQRCVLACPASYDAFQRRELRRRAEAAGWQVERVVPEPIAALVAAGYPQGRHQVLSVCDLGGDSFQISVVTATPQRLRVVAAQSTASGGEAFLTLLVQQVLLEARRQSVALAGDRDQLLEQARFEVAQATRTLAGGSTATIRLSGVGDRDFQFPLTPPTLQELARPLLEQLQQAAAQALAQSGFAYKDLDQVLVCGGAQAPVLLQALEQAFGQRPRPITVTEPVAVGAALLADGVAKTGWRGWQELPASRGLASAARRSLLLGVGLLLACLGLLLYLSWPGSAQGPLSWGHSQLEWAREQLEQLFGEGR
ncbi:MAG: Hsp70 family protein, partial [Deinococcus sp.]|nr:Hsp70 family protein [Deinococcus sp.]